jgi:glycosyltransferase involved in cell wall biosynthesis
MKEDTYLSIVIPLYNEEESVKELINKLNRCDSIFQFEYEIILVDDGSTDNTWDLLKKHIGKNDRYIAIRLNRNYGQTAAMVAGFNHSSAEVIATMDGDLQNDPEDIPKLLEQIEEGFDIVSGWRKYRKDAFFRVFLSKVANKIISLTTGVSLHDYGCSLKVYRAECIKSIRCYGEMHRFFPALASMTGAKVAEMPVAHSSRKYGQSKYGFSRIFKVFSDIIAMNLIIRFSSKTLIGFTKCAIPPFLLMILWGALGGYASVFDWTAGKATIFFIIAGLMGMSTILLITLGIIGELVNRFSDLDHAQLPEITKKKYRVAASE